VEGHLAKFYGKIEAINRERGREFNTFSKKELSLFKHSLSKEFSLSFFFK